MTRARHPGLWAIGLFLALSAAAGACGSDGGGDGAGDGDGSGDDGSSDDGTNTTGGCVNEGCDPSSTSSTGEPGECPSAGQITYPMHHTGGPSMCQGYGPDECGVVNQDGCEVTVECTGFPPLTVTIDTAGVSEEVAVPIGDGVVADCHIEVSTTALALTLVCSAQGVTCEWGGSYP